MLLALAPATAVNLAGVQNAHDPGTVTRDGDTWFNFTTGTGIWYSTSTDLVTWSAAPAPVFSAYPAWIRNKIPSFGGAFWAPDVIHKNDGAGRERQEPGRGRASDPVPAQ